MRGHPRFIVVTPHLIEAAGTRGCGYTDKQIEILDGPGRPQQGWRQRAIGKRLSFELGHDLLFAARRQKHRPKPGSLEESRALALLDACANHARPQRAAALRSAAMTMQAPIADEHLAGSDAIPSWIDLATGDATEADDTACPLCHGDELGRPSCPLCARAYATPEDPWSTLSWIAAAAMHKPSPAAARKAISQAARALQCATSRQANASREIAITARFVRALELCAQHDEAGA